MKVLGVGKRICKQIRKNWKDISWWKRVPAHWLIHNFYYGRVISNKGRRVMEEDWDNLIILDACRYDLFLEVTGSEADYIISRGSSTAEFLKENIAGHKYADTVVVTANPIVSRMVKNNFHKILPVWKAAWDYELNTVLPQTMIQYALESERKYPDKRLIVWFIQPHYPFIENPEIYPSGMKRALEVTKFNRSNIRASNPWKEVAMGNLEIDKVWQAYKRNLQIVIPYAFELARQLKGKTVITADHGETFERLRFPLPVRVAGHPHRTHILSLVKVPWLVFESQERKEIKGGLTPETERIKVRLRRLKESGKLRVANKLGKET